MIARMGKTRFIICAALVLVVCAAQKQPDKPLRKTAK